MKGLSSLSTQFLFIFSLLAFHYIAYSFKRSFTTRQRDFIILKSSTLSQDIGLLSIPFDEFSEKIGGSGRAKIAWDQIRIGNNPFSSDSTHLSTKAKEMLSLNVGEFQFLQSEIIQETPSPCGTRKFLQRLHDGLMIESVLIPAYKFDRTTLCVSTQVGCDRGCAFCATGKMGLVRNLTSNEILSQVFHGLSISRREQLPLMTNIVFMGMGDAGRNIDSVGRAALALTDRQRFQMAHRKITVSTVGPSPEIFFEIAKLPVTIAWSLHAADDGLRRLLVPSTRHSTVQLRDGLAAALQTRAAMGTRTIMIAVTLVEEINDREEDAQLLAQFLRPLLVVAPKIAIDLIPYNDIHIPGFNRPSRERVNAFQQVLREEGYFCSVRVTRGDEESAACGMLATKRLKSQSSSSTMSYPSSSLAS